MAKNGNTAEKLKEITDKLEQGIKEIFESEKYKEYLGAMSKFHNYSLDNTVLIVTQKPDASLVAGFQSWKKNFRRNVKKGEKGIRILAPTPYKIKRETGEIDPKTGERTVEEITVPAYRPVYVFDVSQTEGEPLPMLGVDELEGGVRDYDKFLSVLENISPVPIGFEEMDGTKHGYYHIAEKRIAIKPGMGEMQTLKTAIHEIAHATLHADTEKDSRTKEVEAESVAYVVCQHYGLDTSDYSFGYVAGWSSGKELPELKSSLSTIRETAAGMIGDIDREVREREKEPVKEWKPRKEKAEKEMQR